MNILDYKTKTSLILPFKGIWIVGNGGRDASKNNHRGPDGNGPKDQMFAYDFIREHKGKGKNLEDYEAFGLEVIAPADGSISQVINGSMDNPVGDRDLYVIPGNRIVIDHKNGEWSMLAHLKFNSIKVKVGDKVKGKVVVLADYGAFIEVAEGVEGLIHVSEMSWSTHLRSAQDFMKIGDVVEAVVLTLDRDERKMSLGIKQMTQDPWTDITAKYPVGSKHTGIVRNFTNFGIFVELEEGIDGLVYISDLSWTKKIKHPSEFVNVGEKLDVVVLELDVEGRKLSLGHKQTTANPWDKYEDAFAVGTIHNGAISEIVDKGATVEFGDDIVAFIPTRHLEKEDGKKLKKGDTADFKVIEFNKEFKRVVASHTAIFREEEEKNVKTAVETTSNSSAQTSTLGDNNDILAELKAKMEKGGK